MFERPGSGERCAIVHLNINDRFEQDSLAEFRDLAVSAGALPLVELGGRRAAPDPRYFIGSGKVDELKALIARHAIELVLVDHPLSPAQERNLEKAVSCRVLDRTGLILDIFAQRARSFEGKLQVELAQLEHLSTRLVRGWTHLERQKGGIGLRGPGETQLETDRRLLGGRIKQIRRRLEKVRQQRQQGRQARRKAEVPTVALVGYTNAGKSTLFNRLTEAGVLVADQLFATLDPTLRRLRLPGGRDAILADTVGFIRDLPHELVEAFLSTLQETREAQLLLHVVDASDPDRGDKKADVQDVLQQIGADSVPQLVVYNKIDCIREAGEAPQEPPSEPVSAGHPAPGRPGIERDAAGLPTLVRVSATTGAGIDDLLAALDERLSRPRVHGWLVLGPALGRIRAHLFETEAVVRETHTDDGGCVLELDMDEADWQRLVSRESTTLELMPAAPVNRLAGLALGQ